MISKIFFNFLPCLFVVALSFLLSCDGLRFGDEYKPKPSKTSLVEITENLKSNIHDYLELSYKSRFNFYKKNSSNSDQTLGHLNKILDHTSDIIEVFKNHIVGEKKGQYTIDELHQFMQEWIFKEQNVSRSLIEEFFLFKKAFVGGSETLLLEEELELFSDVLDSIRHSIRRNRYKSVQVGGIVNLFLDHFKFSYSFHSINSFINEIIKFNKNTEAQDFSYMDWSIVLDNFLYEGKKVSIDPNEMKWIGDILEESIDGFLYYHQSAKVEHLEGKIPYYYLSLGHAIRVLKNIILFKKKAKIGSATLTKKQVNDFIQFIYKISPFPVQVYNLKAVTHLLLGNLVERSISEDYEVEERSILYLEKAYKRNFQKWNKARLLTSFYTFFINLLDQGIYSTKRSAGFTYEQFKWVYDKILPLALDIFNKSLSIPNMELIGRWTFLAMKAIPGFSKGPYEGQAEDYKKEPRVRSQEMISFFSLVHFTLLNNFNVQQYLKDNCDSRSYLYNICIGNNLIKVIQGTLNTEDDIQKFLKTLSDDQKQNYKEKLIRIAQSLNRNQLKLDLLPVMAVLTVQESLFIRFDKDRNQVLDEEELETAQPLFVDVIAYIRSHFISSNKQSDQGFRGFIANLVCGEEYIYGYLVKNHKFPPAKEDAAQECISYHAISLFQDTSLDRFQFLDIIYNIIKDF